MSRSGPLPGSERRRHPRRALRLPVTVMYGGNGVPGDLVDISEGGLQFSCRAQISISDRVLVQIQVMPDLVCEGVGRVVRDAGLEGFGVQFDKTNEAMSTFIADFLSLREELQSDFLAKVVNPMVMVRGS